MDETKQTQIVKINEKGLFDFRDHVELGHAALMLIQTKHAPDHLSREGKLAVASALILCKQFGLPQKAMNQMAFIKGKLTCYGSLVTALAERHPEYGAKREYFVDENCDEICVKNKNLKAEVFAAVVEIKKKSDNHWTQYFFSIEDAQTAGLITNNTKADSGWKKYFKDMLMHKARKRALQSEYASALEGIEYHEDVATIDTARDVTPDIDSVKNDFHSVDGEYKTMELRQ